ncbi:MAG: serine O-acetyltransferase [Oscillospiraceae bacterium]|jgi:serine O-acetyltransferase|nr:serine O-acetyltransferase [Oscillospiraceae bacterium]
MFDGLRETIQAYKKRDPAAKSGVEIFLLYPGIHAYISHKIAHWLYSRRRYFLARAVSQWSRFITGIEIHPGAVIGRRLVIDHGTGIIIGETAELGDDVLLYQGVTLGGTGKDTGKRHPTIGNNVLIGAGAKVLGPFKVGDNSRIAAGAVVLKEIPPDSTAVGVPARVVRIAGQKPDFASELDQVNMADPVAIELSILRAQVDELEKKVSALEREGGSPVGESVSADAQTGF